MCEQQKLSAREIFAQNLNALMRRTQTSQSDLVSRFGITASTVSDWCNGKKYPRVDKIQLLADYFGVQRSQLTEDGSVGIPYIPTQRIPILGRVSAGLPIYADEHIEGYTYTDHGNAGDEYFALRVQGNSMNAARIFDGDILIIRRQDIVENREIAVVMVGEDEATVKRFCQSGSVVTLIPESTDASFRPQSYDLRETPIRILGKVVENKIVF